MRPRPHRPDAACRLLTCKCLYYVRIQRLRRKFPIIYTGVFLFQFLDLFLDFFGLLLLDVGEDHVADHSILLQLIIYPLEPLVVDPIELEVQFDK